MSNLVVISHYDAWPDRQLVQLLDQMRDVPAGDGFDLCVVVNQCGDEMLRLPERHAAVTVLHHPNLGYNIGAWEHGWRKMPAYDNYLFVQEECRLLRRGWLSAFTRRLADDRIGLLGESMAWAGLSWSRLDRKYRNNPFADKIDGASVPIPVGIRAGLERLGVPIGSSGAHLQSLVWATRRAVLEAIDGFIVAESYGDATVAETAVSKKVEALGLVVREVGPGSFRYILHPQWASRRGIGTGLARRIAAYLPVDIATGARARLVARRRS